MHANLKRPERASGIACAALLAAAVAAAPALAQTPPEYRSDFSAATVPPPDYCVLLENGVIHTMDAANTVVSSVMVQDGKFTVIGPGRSSNNCLPQRIIDLGGRTVVPGLIDSHDHVILLGLRPGHDVRIENADKEKDVLGAFAARAAEVPAGEWLTAIGGFHINQFLKKEKDKDKKKEKAPRFPTLEELDQATPRHPVFIMQGVRGPSYTNSKGKPLLQVLGVGVGADGSIAEGAASLLALNQLRRMDQADGKRLASWKRGTVNAMTYAAAIGITTHLDQGGLPAAGDDTDSAAHFDRYRAFDAMLELNKEKKLTTRMRVNFSHFETVDNTPELLDRLKNTHHDFGDDWQKAHGIGEFTASGFDTAWRSGTRLVARPFPDVFRAAPEGSKWTNENQSVTRNDFVTIVDEWTAVHNELVAAGETDGLAKRRWVLSHAPFITQDYVARLKAIGGGISMIGSTRYLTGEAGEAGPPFRTIVDSGIRAGLGSDGGQAAPLSPWLNIYYAVTGKNARGDRINAGQQLSRAEAIRLYTAANAWFTKDEATLGTIELGKKADLVVLSADYFKVDDEEIKDLYSKLTMVNGGIVWDDLDGQQKKYWNHEWRSAHGFH